MKPCLICGEKKSPEEFYRQKHFYKYEQKYVHWCRDCQLMYIHMKQEEKFVKAIQNPRTVYTISFS